MTSYEELTHFTTKTKQGRNRVTCNTIIVINVIFQEDNNLTSDTVLKNQGSRITKIKFSVLKTTKTNQSLKFVQLCFCLLYFVPSTFLGISV